MQIKRRINIKYINNKIINMISNKKTKYLNKLFNPSNTVIILIINQKT